MGLFSDVKTYAPSEVFLTVGGYNVEGWNKISVRKVVPEFTTIRGIRGKHTRVRSKDGYATISVDVDMTSKANVVFKAILAKDIELGGARIEIQLADKSGTELFSTTEAFIQGSPERSYEKDITSRVWVIECLNSRWTDPGSGGLINSIFG